MCEQLPGIESQLAKMQTAPASVARTRLPITRCQRSQPGRTRRDSRTSDGRAGRNRVNFRQRPRTLKRDCWHQEDNAREPRVAGGDAAAGSTKASHSVRAAVAGSRSRGMQTSADRCHAETSQPRTRQPPSAAADRSQALHLIGKSPRESTLLPVAATELSTTGPLPATHAPT